MGAFNDLDEAAEKGKEKVRDAKNDFDEWREENL
jgi:hypothetical protein